MSDPKPNNPPNSFPTPPQNEPGHLYPGGPTPTFNPPPPSTTTNTTTTATNPTQDYHLNHLAIRITDPSRSLHFYVDLLGMRTIFTFNAGPFTIYYLGHPPAHITTADGLAAWARETSAIPALTRTKGLLELYHIHGTEKVENGNEAPGLGFAHLGFTVPDVKGAVARLRDAGVRVLKEVGTCAREEVPLSKWEEERGVGVGEIHENYAAFFREIAMVADPDGYWVELVPQQM
ncbi:hypothetical protein N7539_001159 [Penicillium diatomitis]|uniref:VOC domain-containing protein n=1 Tax=Penicillium diatomitis TaxID=2819901 RepID=A0A9X0C2V4_9EURO|nr:uncharacterized protein N7539_001159 [Penicillium diatomitis]KAJ5496043.1 hypothetical protein N7539_001159 [Penicillium diatomitis]